MSRVQWDRKKRNDREYFKKTNISSLKMFLKLKNSWKDQSRKKSENINYYCQEWNCDYHCRSTDIKKDSKKFVNTEFLKSSQGINGTNKWI